MKRILQLSVLAIVLLCGVAYGVDYVALQYRARFADIKVDQLYTVPNKWNEIEWSRGDPVMERCVNAAFPHYGYRPCWYVRRHTMNVNSL